MTQASRVVLRSLCVLCACLGLLSATGCVSGNLQVDKALSSLRAGDNQVALAWSEDLKHSFNSKKLGCLETGRVRMLSGDFLGSSTNFAVVIDQIIEKSENGPVLKLGSAGANVMAGTLTDDRTRAYDVPAYEFIQALHYQMLNDIFLGNTEAAGVEARRTVFAQDAIAEKYGKEVKEAQLKAASNPAAALGQEAQTNAAASNQVSMLGTVDRRMQGMAPVIELTRSSFENGLAWYLCGVLFEQQDDISNAALSYRKAWELVPGNPYIQKDFLRLIRTQDAEMFKGLVAKTGVDPKTLVRNKTEVILIVEESFVSQRQSVKIPLPIGGTLTSVDFPIYQDPAYSPMALEVREKDATSGLSALALSVQSLAYRDLKEKIPGVMIRNVTRVGTHIALQQVANHGGNYVKAAAWLFNLFSTVINKADTRAWCTLPMASQLYRGGVAPGEHMLELRNQVTGFVTQFPVTVAQGETRIVWVADIGGNARIATASLNGKGGTTTFQVCNSMLGIVTPVASSTSQTAPLSAAATSASAAPTSASTSTPTVPAVSAAPPVTVPAVPVTIPVPAPVATWRPWWRVERNAVTIPVPAPVATPTTATVPDVVPDPPVAKPVIRPISLFGIAPRAARSPDERGLSGTHAKDANWGVPSGGTNILMDSEKKGYK